MGNAGGAVRRGYAPALRVNCCRWGVEEGGRHDSSHSPLTAKRDAEEIANRSEPFSSFEPF